MHNILKQGSEKIYTHIVFNAKSKQIDKISRTFFNQLVKFKAYSNTMWVASVMVKKDYFNDLFLHGTKKKVQSVTPLNKLPPK